MDVKTRAVGVVRRSKSADPASNSIPAQKQIIQGYADAQNIIIVGWAIDSAVSAFHVPPHKRKFLKAWLVQADDFDCFVYWRQDRIVRRVFDFVAMVQWCKDLGKKLYSATEGLGDVTEHTGMLPGLMKAWMAEGESINTGDRVRPNMERLRQQGRYGGGRIAYWQTYICLCHDRHKCPDGKDCKGWKVVIDEAKAPNIREAARRVTAGESTNAVVADFNRRGVLSQDGKAWCVPVLRGILRNRNLMTGGLLTPEEWGQLQDALDRRSFNRTVRTMGRDSIILDLVFCDHCGGKMWRQTCHDRDGKPRIYAQCQNRVRRYENPRVPCDLRVPYHILESFVQADVKAHWDDIIESRVTNQTRKLRVEEIDNELLALTADKVSGRVTRAEFTQRQAALMDEAEALESDGARPRWRVTGETVGQRWERLSNAERRLWLLGIGTTYTVRRELSEDGTRKRFVVKSSWGRFGKDGDATASDDEIVELRRERVVRAA